MKESSGTRSIACRGNVTYFRGGAVRPLGTVKPTATTASQPTVPKFPPLHLDRSYDGIHGNAMSVPPVKEMTEREEKVKPQRSPRRVMGSSRSDTGSTKSAESDKSKELRETLVREKQLKQQVASLQQVIDDLRAQLLDKDKLTLELQQQLLQQEQMYRELYEKEETSHRETKSSLEASNAEVTRLQEHVALQADQHQKELDQLEATWKSRLSTVEEEKKKEIAERDEKLNRLKKQMAEALKGNSWERQQQLDELTKELARVQEESDILKMKLKNFSKNSKSSCSNCDSLGSQLGQSQQAIRDRDNLIRDLKTVCGKFENQLSSHETTLLQLTERSHKSRKMPPK